MLAVFPQSARQIRAPAAIPSLHVTWRRQWWWVLLSFSFLPIRHFSQIQFNCYPMAAQDTLPQWIKGIRPRHHHPHPWGVWRRWWHWVFLLFFFHYFKCFLTALFSIKLLFSGWLVLLYFIFIPPPHLNFTMSYVPIKICLPKLPFCVVH